MKRRSPRRRIQAATRAPKRRTPAPKRPPHRGRGRPPLPDPDKRLVARLRSRYDSGHSMVSTDNRYLWKVARAVFGGWTQALQAAGIPPLPRGRPPDGARRPYVVAPAGLALLSLGGPADGTPRQPEGGAAAARRRGPVPAGTCALCGERPDDLGRHLRLVHHVDPRIYEAVHGPVPHPRWTFSSVLEGLRAHLAAGGAATAGGLARRAPSLLYGVRLFFHDLPSAFELAGPAVPLPASHRSKAPKRGSR